MSEWYTLGADRIPVLCGDFDELLREGRWMPASERRVAETWMQPRWGWGNGKGITWRNTVRVSTVFLQLDHGFSSGSPPILFETMIFGGLQDQYQERYCTWEEAEAGHKRAERRARLSIFYWLAGLPSEIRWKWRLFRRARE